LGCGGDGTMGWIQSSLDIVWTRVLGPGVLLGSSPFAEHLPLAIMPLGTGNDLSRCYSWGPMYSKKEMGRESNIVQHITNAKMERLDRWRMVVIPDAAINEEHKHWIPDMMGASKIGKQQARGSIYIKRNGTTTNKEDAKREKLEDARRKSMKGQKSFSISQSIRNFTLSKPEEPEEEPEPEKEVLDGIFCNYFSIGFDAQVAFAFHKDRSEHPENYKSVMGNKYKYAIKGITDGTKAPRLRGKMHVFVQKSKKTKDSEENDEDDWEELAIPKNCRSVVLLNIPSYGGGTQLANEGARDDTLIDVIFMTNVWRFSVIKGVSLPVVRHQVAAQVSSVSIHTLVDLHCQVDGEPWLQDEATINIRHFGQSAVLEKQKVSNGCIPH